MASVCHPAGVTEDPSRGAERAAEAEAELVRAGVVAVLDFDDREAIAAWSACDLASMIEGCFHQIIDPHTLDAAARQRWLERLADSYLTPGFRDDAWMTRYLWLLEGGERVGTIALPTTASGVPDLGIWSLYVRPERRGRGVATRVLERAYDAALGVGLQGIRLDTHWPWQRALRFYLRRRMWVTGWKRGIELCRWSELPDWEIREDEPGVAVFGVRRDGGWSPRYRARRARGALEVSPVGEPSEGAEWRFGPATLAVALAARGWPLPSSAGQAEGAGPVAVQLTDLAAAIRRFEAVARERGWQVWTA